MQKMNNTNSSETPATQNISCHLTTFVSSLPLQSSNVWFEMNNVMENCLSIKYSLPHHFKKPLS